MKTTKSKKDDPCDDWSKHPIPPVKDDTEEKEQ